MQQQHTCKLNLYFSSLQDADVMLDALDAQLDLGYSGPNSVRKSKAKAHYAYRYTLTCSSAQAQQYADAAQAVAVQADAQLCLHTVGCACVPVTYVNRPVQQQDSRLDATAAVFAAQYAIFTALQDSNLQTDLLNAAHANYSRSTDAPVDSTQLTQALQKALQQQLRLLVGALGADKSALAPNNLTAALSSVLKDVLDLHALAGLPADAPVFVQRTGLASLPTLPVPVYAASVQAVQGVNSVVLRIDASTVY